jgi:hypothetical protein
MEAPPFPSSLKMASALAKGQIVTDSEKSGVAGVAG